MGLIIFIFRASVPSPCEQRLVIDETDSGVESAIAIEEEAEIGKRGVWVFLGVGEEEGLVTCDAWPISTDNNLS